jgi:omega-6 fatty acid desaturase (delta-12 desaturase)
MGFVSYLQHTHPRVAWYNREDEWSFYHVQLKSTVHIVFPFANTLMDRVMHNIFDHAAHHIDPTIPLTALPECQRDLEENIPEHVVISHWTVIDYLRTTAACKLYDFENHRWLDFNGEPTTDSGLTGLPPMQRDVRQDEPCEVIGGPIELDHAALSKLS